MDERVKHALEHDHLIDITTKGRKTGKPRRIEIRLYHIDGNFYLTGTPPRPRNWYANLLAHPEFTLHLKQSVQADLPAKATPILDQATRRTVIALIQNMRGGNLDLEAWVGHSPLASVELLVRQ
jgi:deazaflavin-dependent oxidoreductase (nitroreductase family)